MPIVLRHCLTTALLLTSLGFAADQTPATGATEHPAPPALTIPDSVTQVEALSYVDGPGADPVRHRLDLYLPNGAKDFPSVVFIHGGGYQRGDRRVGHNLGVVLAAHGVAVASISYRLFPQVRHPAQIEDVARAVAWTIRQIPTRGGDPRRVFVAGHSAGAHLASLLGTDGSYLQTHGLKPADLAGILAISGGYRINPIRKEVFGDEATMAAASPFAHLDGGHPPFLLLYGSLEKPERAAISQELRDALEKTGTRATTQEIPDRDHQGLMDHIGEGDPTVAALLAGIQHPGLR